MSFAATYLANSLLVRSNPRNRHSRYSVAIRRDAAQALPVASALADDGAATVFQSPQWIAAFLSTIGKARNVAYFQVEVRDRKSGLNALIIPLILRQRRGYRILEMPDFGLADYVAPMVADGFRPTPRAMRRIWAQVRPLLPPADLVRFVKMPAMAGSVPNPLLGLSCVRRSQASAWGVPLPAAENAWESTLSCAKRRADLDARWRKLNKRGAVTFETAGSPDEIDRFFAELCRQRAERFSQFSFPNSLDHAEIRDFYRSLLEIRSGPSPAIIQALRVDGLIVAVGYALIGNGAYHMIFPTFQAEGWRNYSPGLHLFRKSMQWAAGQGLTYYDFTVGAEGFKRDFGAREHALHERYEALSLAGLGPVAWLAVKHFIKERPRLLGAVQAVRSLFSRKGS